MRRHLVMLVAALVAGCADGGILGLGGGSPEPRDSANTPARLHVTATYLDARQSLFQVAPPGCVDILAFLTPGTDAQGHQRTLMGDTARVLGQLLHGKREPNGFEWRFEARLPLAPQDFPSRPLIVQAPVLKGASPAYGPVRWYALGRAGPDELTAARSADLALPLAVPADTSTPRPPNESWVLAVRQGSVGIVAFMGGGQPPADLSVPATYLKRAARGELSARLSYRAHRDTVTNAPYEITPVVGSEIAWKVLLTD
jgi:hypothetical protein